MSRLLNKIRFPVWTITLALLVLCAISFGAMASKLGFYWDDWTITYYIHFLGPASFIEAFSLDRPLLGWLYAITTSLFGESPLNWQIYGVFARWLSCLALWWVLRMLWPDKKYQITATTFLFAIYPGFKQGYIAITYGTGFVLYAIFFISMAMMLMALRYKRWFWPLYLISIGLSAYIMFTLEYFFGLELLRPVFLWLLVSENIPSYRKRVKRVCLYWLPYLILMFLFLAWRLSTPTPRGEITFLEKVSIDLIPAVSGLAINVFTDIFKVSVLAWRDTLDLSGILDFDPITIGGYALIVAGVALISMIYLANMKADPASDAKVIANDKRRWSSKSMLLGFWGLLVGGTPIWMTNLRMELFFPWDRFTLPMMLGVSLLVMGVIEFLARTRLQSILIVGVLVGLGAGLHFQSAFSYRQDWLAQRDFFWQLVWRAPGIQPGTVLLTTEMPFLYNTDNSLTAPLNWIYAPENSAPEYPYLLYNVESRLSRGLPPIDDGSNIHEVHRIIPFSGSASQAVAVIYRPPACLRVVDPLADRRMPEKPRFYKDIAPLSNPDLILTKAESGRYPPETFFGQEPQQDWCYYFQKAELARQVGDWEKVAQLGDLALSSGEKIYRKKVIELAPYIEGYAHVGRWTDAVELSNDAHNTWENMDAMLCDLWTRVLETTAPDEKTQPAIDDMLNNFGCGGS